MTMFRFCNDMLLHITNRPFARARSSETNFLIPAVGALQAPCKNARFTIMGTLLCGKVGLPLQRGAYFVKAGSRASSPSFFNEVEICHLGAILGPSWGHPWPTHVADIAEIDKDKKILAQIAKKKRRAGGGRPPQGSQSAARPLWSGPRRVRPALKSCQDL